LNIASLIKPRLRQIPRRAIKIWEQERRDQCNVDITLSSLFGDGQSLAKKNDAKAYVEFVRACIEPVTLRIEVIKSDEQRRDAQITRFASLIDTLRSNLLPVPTGIALAIADLADRFRGSPLAIDWDHWSGDVGLHFSISSSSGHKGRILSTIVRLCRAKQCLELGTAYGLSAIFILEAQRFLGHQCHLTTIEAGNQQFALASDHLTKTYGTAVTCKLGHTQSLLPELARNTAPIDFMFHDAGHSREDYVNDFGAIVSALAPGSVVLIDDIRWDDTRFRKTAANTYLGWRDVVVHPRVRQAIEINGEMGLMQLT
jgi:predicted O-methyltransferase YrrM